MAADKFWASQDPSQKKSVVWVTYDDGAMVLFTRGEYREQIMENIAGGTYETRFGEHVFEVNYDED